MTDILERLELEARRRNWHEAIPAMIEAGEEIRRLRAENEKLRDMLLRSDKLTRQEWYDMRNAQLAEEANPAALKGDGGE